jgi:hypothetical protein
LAALLTGIAVTILVSGLAVAGFLIVDRLVPAATRQRHNEIAGYTYAFIGPLYALLLAFIVVTVWGYNEAARLAAGDEAVALVKVYNIALGMGSSYANDIQRLATAYGQSVINDEWPSLEKGQQGNSKTAAAYRALGQAVEAYTPADDRTGDLYQAEITSLNDLAAARSQRVLRGQARLPAGLWVALFFGAAISIGYAYFFGVEARAAHALMVGLLATSIVGIIYLIGAINGPFQGSVRVLPTAMEEAVSAIQNAQAQH